MFGATHGLVSSRMKGLGVILTCHTVGLVMLALYGLKAAKKAILFEVSLTECDRDFHGEKEHCVTSI